MTNDVRLVVVPETAEPQRVRLLRRPVIRRRGVPRRSVGAVSAGVAALGLRKGEGRRCRRLKLTKGTEPTATLGDLAKVSVQTVPFVVRGGRARG
jgi:hypothetical protein